jgi:RNA polymerase subunit RPABC4/transcription elongation factor Spt4
MPNDKKVVSNRICPQCKRLLEPTWVACPYCGARSLTRNEMKLPPICPHCKALLKEEWQTCPYCGKNPAEPPAVHYDSFYNKPSNAWYLAPLLFGLIGGLIAYVGTKDEDKDMANNLLIFGLIWSIFLFIIFWAWFSSLY